MKPKKPNLERSRELFDLASQQLGFFTARQATELGYSEKNHHFHVTQGNWVREVRGVYRLKEFPDTDPNLQYAMYALWSRGRDDVPQAVISHDSALRVYELSDINPAQIHMTVPKGFRRMAKLPTVLKLHFGSVSKSEMRQMIGFCVTTPLKTLIDVCEEGVISDELIIQEVFFKRSPIN